jgi:hypothetical protein
MKIEVGKWYDYPADEIGEPESKFKLVGFNLINGFLILEDEDAFKWEEPPTEIASFIK